MIEDKELDQFIKEAAEILGLNPEEFRKSIERKARRDLEKERTGFVNASAYPQGWKPSTEVNGTKY